MSQLLKDILDYSIKNRASDIHLATGNKPAIRIDGKVCFLDFDKLSHQQVDEMAKFLMPEDKYLTLINTGDCDCSIGLEEYGRFRINGLKQFNGLSIAMRTINEKLPVIEELGLPKGIDKILMQREGLVLVIGPTGSGKSTTLAAIINYINKHRSSHIITIEDPIEYIHSPINCVINQREIGTDCQSYATALRAALREDPDVILVGEMRDLESVSIALTAAETGHLVFSTLHTGGAAKAIDRLVDAFPADQQEQIRTQLSFSLRAVVSQTLIPHASGKGRVAAFEVMFVTPAISNLIRENKIAHINQAISTGANEFMQTMEKSIEDLIRDQKITLQQAQETFGELKNRNTQFKLR